MTAITAEQLESLFQEVERTEVSGQGSVRRRLLPELSVDVFVEVRLPERDRALVVESQERLGDRELLLATGLTCRAREGHVEVVARPATDSGMFCSLLADLVEHLCTAVADPAAALVNRLGSWQRMLSRGMQAGLTAEQRLGLFGELLFLLDFVLPVLGTHGLVTWLGPTGAEQDFASDTWAVEVKTVSVRNSSSCRISSEHQLDVIHGRQLVLVHQSLRTDPDGMTLGELVDGVRHEPAVPGDPALLENRLLEAGWLDGHRQQYDLERYTLTMRRCFMVNEGFPRITGALVPTGVHTVSYQVDLDACGAYQVDESLVRAFLAARPGGGDEASG